jgi:hypothetical protein
VFAPSSEENIIPGHVLGLTTRKKANSTRSGSHPGEGGGLTSLLAPGSPPERGGGRRGLFCSLQRLLSVREKDSTARSSVSSLLGRRTLLLAPASPLCYKKEGFDGAAADIFLFTYSRVSSFFWGGGGEVAGCADTHKLFIN